MKKYLKILAKVLLILLLAVFSFLFAYINYCPNVYYLVIVLYTFGTVYLLFFYKRKKKLLVGGSFLLINIVSILLCDGLFLGNKVEYSYVLTRGAVRVIFNNTLMSDDKIYDFMFSITKYDEEGFRITDWAPPEDYTWNRFIQDGVIMEELQPVNPSDKVILMLHGGGYAGRLGDNHNSFVLNYSRANNNSAVLAVDYKTSPDYTYTDTIADVMYSYNYLQEKGYSPENIVIAGDSAGGGLALASALYMRDHNIPLPAGIITMSAWTNLACNSESYETNKDVDNFFGQNGILTMAAKAYVQDADPTNPYISPYYGDFTGMPPILMQVGSYEMLLSDSKDIADRFKDNITLQVYPGMFHDFQMLKDSASQADKAWAAVEVFLEELE